MGTVTINGSVYQVYGDLPSATIYMQAAPHLASSWATATPDQQASALVSATRMLENMVWQGVRTAPAPGQPLEWPRTGVVDRYGAAVDSSTIPAAVLNGAYELAGAIRMSSKVITDASGTSSNKKVVQAGSARVEFFVPVAGTRLPTPVVEWLGQFLAGAGGAGAPWPEAYGTDGESQFDLTDRFGLNRGL